MSVSVTISNRRVRTRTHGGVAGVSGQPLPLCRSSRLVGSDLRAWHQSWTDYGETGNYLPGELGVADEFSISRNDENHKFGRLQGLEGD
jgi:hypothetical protein